jgi:ATP-binding cassette subfamily B protein
LHVTNGTIPSGMASRLQTPSVIKWKESFALILKSSQEGILLASPNEGLINISSDNFKNNFEDEINVLLLEKTKETPQKIFNLNWFWPAIQKYKVVLIQVLIASFVVQLFTLGNPLLIQVIIDKLL